MVHTEGFTFTLLHDSTKIIRRIYSLSLHADRFFKGRSDGKKIKEISRQWLIHSTYPPSLILLEKCEENWKKHFEDYPEFIINKLLVTLNKFEKDYVVPTDLVFLSNKLTSILKNSESFKNFEMRELARNLIAELGYQYFSTAINIIHKFERKNFGWSNDNITTSIKTEYIELEVLAYCLAFSGILFVTYTIPNNKYFKKGWCKFCFRKAMLSSNTCELHRYGNKNINLYRLGEVVHNDLINDEPKKFQIWEDFKMCIKDYEDEEREFKLKIEFEVKPELKLELELELKLYLDNPINNWKKTLISFVKSRPVLGTRLSIDKIEQFPNWVEAVQYLRDQLENPEEKSTHPQAVMSWLAMAAEWIKVENKRISIDGKRFRRSKDSDIATYFLILNEFEIDRNIAVKDIAKKIGFTPALIYDTIRKHKDLRKIFLERKKFPN